MKKIYIVIAGAFLLILIITTMLLSLMKKSTTNTNSTTPFPTSVPLNSNGQPVNLPQTGGDQGLRDLSNLSNGSNLSNQSNQSNFPEIETLDFKAAYVPELGKIVVEQKTPQAESMFNQWVNQNNISPTIDSIGGTKNILFTNEKIIPTPSDSVHKLENKVKDFFQLMDDLNNIGKGSPQSNNGTQQSISSSPNPSVSQSPNQVTKPSSNQSTNFTYYAQCGDQGSLSLPNGCNLCNAGCGPTTVAMIASSYLGKQYDPKNIVGQYQSKNYLLGCDGSRYSDAHELLKSLGLQVQDYITFNSEKSDTVVPVLRPYIEKGWTFFALTSFCEAGCGHYFWITDIDAQGHIWAYDPAYGKYQIPYDENSRYPYPLYRLAFGVRK